MEQFKAGQQWWLISRISQSKTIGFHCTVDSNSRCLIQLSLGMEQFKAGQQWWLISRISQSKTIGFHCTVDSNSRCLIQLSLGMGQFDVCLLMMN